MTDVEYWDRNWCGAPIPTYDVASPYFAGYMEMFGGITDRLRSLPGRDLCGKGGKPRMVDVGCGNGLMLRFFKEQLDADVWGVDSSKVVEEAEALAKTLKLDFSVRRIDLMDRDAVVALGKFDVVASIGLIEHFQDPMEPLRRLHGMLAPGGALVTLVPNFHGLFNMLWKLYDKRNYAMHVPITVRQLRAMHQELGLVDNEVWLLRRKCLPGVHDAYGPGRRALARLVRFASRRLIPAPDRGRRVITGDNPGLFPEICAVGWTPPQRQT